MFIRPVGALPHPSEVIALPDRRISPVWYDNLNKFFGALRDAGEGYGLTGDYTALSADAGRTFYTSSGPGTLTWGAATGYGSKHANIVTNVSDRRWTLEPDGATAAFLWPGQTAAVFRVADEWVIWTERRWYTPALVTFHVHHSSGNDANDGLAAASGGYLATIQAAIDLIERYVDNGVNGVEIRVHSSSFTENNVVHTKRLQGNHVLLIRGDHSTPANHVWNVGAGQVGFQARDWSGAIIDGFKFASPGAGATALSCSQHGIIDVWNIEFGTFSGGLHIQSTNGGSVGYVVGAACSITGDFAIHHHVTTANLICTGMTYSIPNARTFTQFLYSGYGGQATYAGVTFSGSGSAGGSTGQKYYAEHRAGALLNGVTLPGATAGTADAATFATVV